MLPSVEDTEKLITLFRKCTNLQAFESHCIGDCDTCISKFVDKSISVLSHFPSLIHYVMRIYLHFKTIALPDLLTSSKTLKYLIYDHNVVIQKLPSLIFCSNLQQVCIKSYNTDLSTICMNAISAHDGLVHVVLDLGSVTCEGVTVLVRNSPNLLTFCIVLYNGVINDNGDKLQPEILETKLKQNFYQRQLFMVGSYVVKVMPDCSEHLAVYCKQQKNTDLFSLRDGTYNLEL